MSAETRRVYFLVFPGAEIMDIAGPLQAVHEAAALGARHGLRYEWHHCGPSPSARTAQGLEVTGLLPLPAVGPGCSKAPAPAELARGPNPDPPIPSPDSPVPIPESQVPIPHSRVPIADPRSPPPCYLSRTRETTRCTSDSS